MEPSIDLHVVALVLHRNGWVFELDADPGVPSFWFSMGLGMGWARFGRVFDGITACPKTYQWRQWLLEPDLALGPVASWSGVLWTRRAILQEPHASGFSRFGAGLIDQSEPLSNFSGCPYAA